MIQYDLVGLAEPFDIVGAAGDPVGGGDAGECEALFKFGQWPESVDAFKKRLGAILYNLHATAIGCPKLPADTRASWEVFYRQTWDFLIRPTPFFGVYDEWVQACATSRHMDAWATVLSKHCTLVGPDPNKVSSGDATALLKALAVAATVVAGAAILIVYAPELKVLLPSRRAR